MEKSRLVQSSSIVPYSLSFEDSCSLVLLNVETSMISFPKVMCTSLKRLPMIQEL